MRRTQMYALLALCLILGIVSLLIILSQPQNETDSQQQAAAFADLTNPTNDDWTPFERTFEDGVTMVLVPAGCFMMGSSDEEIAQTIDHASEVLEQRRSQESNPAIFQNIITGLGGDPGPSNGDILPSQLNPEQPQHRVCFDSPFWIDKTEVTQAQFRALGGRIEYDRLSDTQLPVGVITWFEAMEFCQTNRVEGTRLPTEAEWEYAARGVSGWIYPWGNNWNRDNAALDLELVAVGTHPSGASWVGALDMIGNVSEWVSSAYTDDYQNYINYNIGAVADPSEVSSSGVERVVRGPISEIIVFSGGIIASRRNQNRLDYIEFYLQETTPRAAFRSSLESDGWNHFLGFRCARSS